MGTVDVELLPVERRPKPPIHGARHERRQGLLPRLPTAEIVGGLIAVNNTLHYPKGSIGAYRRRAGKTRSFNTRGIYDPHGRTVAFDGQQMIARERAWSNPLLFCAAVDVHLCSPHPGRGGSRRASDHRFCAGFLP